MNEMKVEIERLEPMRVASFHATSESPEEDAAKMLVEWAQPRGLLEDPEEHPVYGFNNPDPKPGDTVRGYEFWIRVDPAFEAEDAVVKDYTGGLFAVTRVQVKEPWNDIPSAWMRLAEWVEASEYELDPRVCFEKTLDVQSGGGVHPGPLLPPQGLTLLFSDYTEIGRLFHRKSKCRVPKIDERTPCLRSPGLRP